MRHVLAAVLVALALVPAVMAEAPPVPPAAPEVFQGRDQVFIGRIYLKSGGKTEPLARFGTVVGDKPTTKAVEFKVPGAGAMSVAFTAKRSGRDEAKVSWSLQPQSGSGIGAAQGNVDVREGGISHAPLATTGDGELFASLETGRVSTFNIQRLWEHFGILTDTQRFSQAQAQWVPPSQAPAIAAAAAPAPPPPRGGSMTVACPSGHQFDLSTGTGAGRCELDLDGDRVKGGRCDDDAGNAAVASCAVGSCVSVAGRASCSMR